MIFYQILFNVQPVEDIVVYSADIPVSELLCELIYSKEETEEKDMKVGNIFVSLFLG